MIKICRDFTQGDTFNIPISHIPVENITGAIFVFTLKRRISDDTPELQIIHTVGDNVLDDAVNGEAYIDMTAEITAAITPGRYYASLSRSINGDVHTVLQTGKDGVDFVTVYRS